MGPDAANSERILKTLAFDQIGQTGADGQSEQQHFAPMDMLTMKLSMNFDLEAQRTPATALIRFKATDDGLPCLILGPAVTSATLDGGKISTFSVQTPDHLTRLTALNHAVDSGTEHTLELRYDLPASEVTYREAGVGFVTAMADLRGGQLFEKYGPSNFEADQFQLTVELQITGDADYHQVFSNGQVRNLGSQRWSIEFPAYFNNSAIYFHLTDSVLRVKRLTYPGLERSIPITIYSENRAPLNQAVARIKDLFSELEGTFGPYRHASFTAYVSGGSGGMEHAGAAITSVRSLGHELTHSWFARGVMPAQGRAGWIDEAVASWRDYGFERKDPAESRERTVLSQSSPFELFTPVNVYVDGRALLANLDFMFVANGGEKNGLKPILARFFSLWQGQVVTPEIFQGFLESESGISLQDIFSKYVYQAPGAPNRIESQSDAEYGFHPRPLTQRQIVRLR